MRRIILSLCAALTLAACADDPSTIPAQYVSPSTYSGLSCRQLNAEARAVNNALVQATGAQQRQADNDEAMTAVALILFWPAAFAIGGNDNSAQIANLRGQAEAISAAARAKGC